MTLAPTMKEAMLGAIPSLRAFAISLSGNVERADDLVQETLMRAIAHADSFEPNTNMPAWLFTILRNRRTRPTWPEHAQRISGGDSRSKPPGWVGLARTLRHRATRAR